MSMIHQGASTGGVAQGRCGFVPLLPPGVVALIRALISGIKPLQAGIVPFKPGYTPPNQYRGVSSGQKLIIYKFQKLHLFSAPLSASHPPAEKLTSDL